MKNTFKLLLIATLFGNLAFSQKSEQLTAPKLGTIYLEDHQEKWNVNLQNLEMPSPDGTSEASKLLAIKKQVTEQYPRRFQPTFNTKNMEKSLGDSVFTSVTGFEGNPYNNRVPNDNSIAISNGGILISCINSRYMFYDTDADTLMKQGFLNDFIASYNLTVSKYDPKMTYDPNEDRFILTFLIGTKYQNSKIAVCFSTTNNPMDAWNVYLLDGNALGTNHWTDYPAVAVNDFDFFLTGNLLYNDSSWQTGFYQSIIWQIDKQSGYNGDANLAMTLWSDIFDGPIKVRNIHPAKGARTLHGPSQYFVSTKNFAIETDTVYLIKIDNNQSSTNPQLTVKRLSTPDHYFMSPNAKQSIAKELATNDSRVLGAIADGDWIQYVHNSLDTTNGTCGVYHGLIRDYETANPTVSGYIISDTVMDLGYPNIASSAELLGDESCVIGFNFTSPVDTNGVAAVYMNSARDYSNIIKLKVGTAPIDILSSSPDRWGDYFGIQRKFNEPCEIWTGGMYGKPGANGCYINSVRTANFCEGNYAITENKIKSKPSVLFPNPARENVSIDFQLEKTGSITISILDMSGKLVATLFEDGAKKGMNRLSFDIHHLSKGTYLVQVLSNNQTQLIEKLVIE